MVVPGKNLTENGNKENSNNKKMWLFIGIGVGAVILIIGLVLLFKFIIFSPSKEEVTENDIEKILNSVKKDESSESPAYGGLTESEKKLKDSFEKNPESGINEKTIINSKENIGVKKEEKENKIISEPKVIQEKEIKKEPAKQEKEVTIKKQTEEVKPKIEIKKQAAVVTPNKEIKKEPVKEVQSNGNQEYKFTIQIASFENPKNAQKEIKNLESRGFKTELKNVDIAGRGTWYRLRVGKFKTREEAKTELWQVNSVGYKNAIITGY